MTSIFKFLVQIIAVSVLAACNNSSAPTMSKPSGGEQTSNTNTSNAQCSNGGSGQNCSTTNQALLPSPSPDLVLYNLNLEVMRLKDTSTKVELSLDNQQSWQALTLSSSGTQSFPQVCRSSNDSVFHIRFIDGSKTITPSSHECVVGYKTPGVFYIGFDDECDETGTYAWKDIDDIILKFSCEASRDFAIKDAWVSKDIVLNTWLGK